MQVIFTITSYQRQSMGDQAQYCFDESGGTFGRSVNNQWVLADPDRIISSQHGQVSFQSGSFYLTDISTNGTFVSDELIAIGKGNSVTLNEGEVIRFGEYEVTVSLQQVQAAEKFESLPNAEPFDSSSAALASSFDILADHNGASSTPPSPAPLVNSTENNSFDPAVNSVQSSDTPVPGISAPSFDPLAGLGSASDEGVNQSSQLGGIESNLFESNSLTDNQDPFTMGSNNGAFDEHFSPAQSNHSDSLRDPFIAPSIESQDPYIEPEQIDNEPLQRNNLPTNSPSNGSVLSESNFQQIPDDWDLTDFSLQANQQGQQADPFASDQQFESNNFEAVAPPANTVETEPQIIQASLDDAQGISQPIEPLEQADDINVAKHVEHFVDPFAQTAPEIQGVKEPQVLPNQNADELAGMHVEEVGASDSASPAPQTISPPAVDMPATAPQVASKSVPTQTEQIPASTNTSHSDHYNRFLKALAMDEALLAELDQGQMMEEFGGLFREMLKGLIELQQARSLLKNEFRMSQTTIRPIENNPLKFAPNIDEALRIFLLNKGTGYLSANDSIKESVAEIRNHQIAMISAMEAAFSQLMQRLTPENFEGEKEGGVLKVAMKSIGKKSSAWQNYVDFYQDQVRDSGNAFQLLFGDAFVDSYEQQIRHISANKNK